MALVASPELMKEIERLHQEGIQRYHSDPIYRARQDALNKYLAIKWSDDCSGKPKKLNSQNQSQQAYIDDDLAI